MVSTTVACGICSLVEVSFLNNAGGASGALGGGWPGAASPLEPQTQHQEMCSQPHSLMNSTEIEMRIVGLQECEHCGNPGLGAKTPRGRRGGLRSLGVSPLPARAETVTLIVVCLLQ